jgi:hypothetical protein
LIDGMSKIVISVELDSQVFNLLHTYADVISRASGGNPVTVFVASNIIPVSLQRTKQTSNEIGVSCLA